jgi:hypothetical protein
MVLADRLCSGAAVRAPAAGVPVRVRAVLGAAMLGPCDPTTFSADRGGCQ